MRKELETLNKIMESGVVSDEELNEFAISSMNTGALMVINALMRNEVITEADMPAIQAMINEELAEALGDFEQFEG